MIMVIFPIQMLHNILYKNGCEWEIMIIDIIYI
jgi:hypothetical protein